MMAWTISKVHSLTQIMHRAAKIGRASKALYLKVVGT